MDYAIREMLWLLTYCSFGLIVIKYTIITSWWDILFWPVTLIKMLLWNHDKAE